MAKAPTTYTGAPCKDCGSAIRYIKGNACAACRRAYRRLEYMTFTKEHRSKTQAWHQANRERHNEVMRAGQLRRKFGITPEQYDAIASAQGKLCAICRKACITDRKLAVDHCHTTNRIRGLLCNNCNIGLGKLRDDPIILERALAYLLECGSGNTTISNVNEQRKNQATTGASKLTEIPTSSSSALESFGNISSTTFTFS